MRNIVLSILMLAASFPASAQWRLDADVRLGQTNVDYEKPWGFNSGWGIMYNYFDAFSWGVDVNIGREFNRGWGVYSGLMYDMMRFTGCDKVTYKEGEKNLYPTGMHVFSFVTVPVRVEYRCVKDIVRPFVGFGASFQCAEHRNITEDIHGFNIYDFNHNVVVPTAMFGLNLEYKRFIVGIGRKIDLKEFWRDNTTRSTWRLAQTTAKIGFRIF